MCAEVRHTRDELLGCQPQDLDWSGLADLVAGRVPQNLTLDYKREL